ncbi:MAG: ROK family transcriptional regulator [Marinosulfonomonas sp.]
MDGLKIRALSGGANQSGLRDYNERLLLSMLQRSGPLAGGDLARQAGLSPQTVSVISRKLEKDGLLNKGDAVRGKVGKPSRPLQLNQDGVFSFGLKVGRRSAELLLLDFVGNVRKQIQTVYKYPLPRVVFRFLEEGIKSIEAEILQEHRQRLCGIGIAAPFEMWKWKDFDGAKDQEFQDWKNINFVTEVAKFSRLSVVLLNDATASCRAEHLYGRGRQFQDYAYFFVGAFVGGGVVLNDTVFEGNQGNAGAFGSLRSTGPKGESRQLVDVASLYLLEQRLDAAGLDSRVLWQQPQDWSALSQHVEPWVDETARELAKASLSICSVIDFEAILIDGALPEAVRTALVRRVNKHIGTQDTRGLIVPHVESGSIGEKARSIGAASSPIFAQFFLNTNAGLSS